MPHGRRFSGEDMSFFTTRPPDEPETITLDNIIAAWEDLKAGRIRPTDHECANHYACKELMQLRCRQQRKWN